jgi:hypothetical protein
MKPWLLEARAGGQTVDNVTKKKIFFSKEKRTEERVEHKQYSECIFRMLYRPEVPVMSLETKTCVRSGLLDLDTVW